MPADKDEFIGALHQQLEWAFRTVIQRDLDMKEERMLKSEYLLDVKFEKGDRVLHYRVLTDEEESMKITG